MLMVFWINVFKLKHFVMIVIAKESLKIFLARKFDGG